MRWTTEEAEGAVRDRAIESISKAVVFAGEERIDAWANMLSAAERRIACRAIDSMPLAEKVAARVNKVLGP